MQNAGAKGVVILGSPVFSAQLIRLADLGAEERDELASPHIRLPSSGASIVSAQTSTSIGAETGTLPNSGVKEIQQRLHQLGYIEGQNIAFEVLSVQG
jgi:hypothetical protein